MQSIEAMNTIPEFKKPTLKHHLNIANKAKKIRNRCYELIKDGERDLINLASTLKVHRSTLILYLKELHEREMIVFKIGGRVKAEIVGVL